MTDNEFAGSDLHIPETGSLPADTYARETLAHDGRMLIDGASPSLFSTEQIESVLPGHPGIAVAVPAVVRVAGGKEYWVVAAEARDGYDFGDMFQGTSRQDTRDDSRERVSDKSYYLIDPEATVRDEAEGAGEAQRKKSGSLIRGNGFTAITQGSEGYVISPSESGEAQGAELARVLVVEGGQIMVSNRGAGDIEVVTTQPTSLGIIASGEQAAGSSSEAPLASQTDGVSPEFAGDLETPAIPVDDGERQARLNTEVQRIFSSAESFTSALSDEHLDQLDPNLRGQLHALQEAWRGVHVAAEGNEFWQEQIQGNLLGLTDVLSTMRYQGRILEDAIEEAQQGLNHLQSAIYDRSNEDVAGILQRYRFTDSFEDMRYRIGQLDQMGLDAVNNRLRWHALETDEHYLALRRGIDEMNEHDTDRMVAEFRDRLGQGADLRRLTADYADEHGYETARWQRRRDALDTIAELSRRTNDQALEIQINRVRYAWDDAFNRLRGALVGGSGADEEEVGYIRSLLNQPLDEVQYFRRLAQLTELATEEAS